MKTIIEFNYQVTSQRGLINDNTTVREFVLKLEEEVKEFLDAALHDKGDFNHELADIILVCLNISRHYGIDIEQQLLNNISKNLLR